MNLTEHGALREGVSIHEAIMELARWEEIGITMHEARTLALLRPGIRQSVLTQYRCPVCGRPIAPGEKCCL